MKFFAAFPTLLSSIFCCSMAFAIQDNLEKALGESLSRINENSVTGTISFLAGDELAGRGTGTPEFNIAAAYVASRFKNAGLVGGAKDGGFFHEKETAMDQTPSKGIEFATADGHPLAHLGMLRGVAEDVIVTGKVSQVDLSKVSDANITTKIVVAKYVSPEGRRGRGGLSQISDAAVQLRAKAVEALILTVDPNDQIVAMAEQLRASPRPANTRSALALPVLLVEQSQFELLSEVKIVLPRQIATTYKARNVIGILNGSDPKLADEAILFTAHLDHLGRREGQDDPIYNGADDDASGVTAVLTLADAFGTWQEHPRRSVIFMTFWGEESGLLGSKDYAVNPSWPLEKIVANINIEMIGRPEPGANSKIWVTGWEKSDLGKLMNDASKEVGVEIFEHPQYSAMLYKQSDNWSLAEKGVIAHSFSAGSLHSDYHQPGDEWQKLNIPHMTAVIKGLYVGSLPIVSGKVTPKAPK